MLTSRRISLALGALLVSLLVFATAALADEPATVTVRIEGLTETKLPSTTITTTTTPVVNDGNPADACSGTSALGALQIASNGNWSGSWESGQYFINAIEGESHLYQSGALSYYWSFWVNDVYQEVGACDAQLERGDRVLFFPECDEECPSGPTPTPLEIEAPASANVGEPVTVIVKQYNAKGEPSPAVGAEVAWSGGSATANAQGDAAVTLTATGPHTLSATGSKAGPPAVRTEAGVCVHNGNDGTCGTSANASSSSSTSSTTTTSATAGAAPIAPYKGSFALVPHVDGLLNGHTYRPGSAPRVLAGSVNARNAVSSVSVELRREYKRKCSAYEGVRERFVAARCGHGSFFKVASGASFSYLLPSALAPGRYVLDIQATDVAGNTTTLARGSSRIVFYVR
jgi:hypothetical protein